MRREGRYSAPGAPTPCIGAAGKAAGFFTGINAMKIQCSASLPVCDYAAQESTVCTLASSIWARVSILLPGSTLSISTPRDFISRSGVTHLVAQLVWPHQPENSPAGLELGGSVHKGAHPCFPCFIQPSFNSIDAGSIYHPLVQLNPSINHSYLKNNTYSSPVCTDI